MTIDRDLLFTPSIYDAYVWATTCPPSWSKRAFDDLVRALTRAPWEPTKAIQRGITFENTVYRVAAMPPEARPQASENFNKVVAEVEGGIIQKKLKKIEVVNGQSFCLYGKTDAWFPDVIKDVKTTANFKRGKYVDSLQHRMYCHIDQNKRFRYVVAVFNDDEYDKKVQRIETIDIEYTNETLEMLETYVHQKIGEFWDFIQNDKDLLDAYLNKFCLY